uniref:Uncharacterized protein n=1 Tax=Ditylenchus dipsaci TaxID=166011 RepID=A0A915DKJ5_9BILA
MKLFLLFTAALVGYCSAHSLEEKDLIGITQSAAVQGSLMCFGKPASNVVVKLYDEDTPDPDDLLEAGKTDSRGCYSLQGFTDEITTIDPKLNIYHDCNDGIKPCQRKFTLYIPKAYVSKGQIAKKIYNAGVLELSGKFPGETRDCIH